MIRTMIAGSRRGALATLSGGVMLLLPSCGDSDSGTQPGEGSVEVEVTPSEVQAESIGQELGFEAQALDSDGNEVVDVSLEWSSGNSEVLEHEGGGRFVTVAEGSATVQASVIYDDAAGVAGPSGSASVEVVQVPVAIEVRPENYTLWALEQLGELEAVVVDAEGTPVEEGHEEIRWGVEDPDVVEVREDGTLVAKGDGSTEVTGEVGEDSGSATVSVEASFEVRACVMDPDDPDTESGCDQRSVTVHVDGG